MKRPLKEVEYNHIKSMLMDGIGVNTVTYYTNRSRSLINYINRSSDYEAYKADKLLEKERIYSKRDNENKQLELTTKTIPPSIDVLILKRLDELLIKVEAIKRSNAGKKRWF